MADQEGRGAIVARSHPDTKGIRPRVGRCGRFDSRMPPLPRQMAEIVMRKSRCQQFGRAADIADEGRTLTDLVHNIDRYPMNGEYGLCRLQCARVRRNNDAGQRGPGELSRRGRRLLCTERRQFRILDARIHPGLGEMQVKVALTMAEQKHAESL